MKLARGLKIVRSRPRSRISRSWFVSIDSRSSSSLMCSSETCGLSDGVADAGDLAVAPLLQRLRRGRVVAVKVDDHRISSSGRMAHGDGRPCARKTGSARRDRLSNGAQCGRPFTRTPAFTRWVSRMAIAAQRAGTASIARMRREAPAEAEQRPADRRAEDAAEASHARASSSRRSHAPPSGSSPARRRSGPSARRSCRSPAAKTSNGQRRRHRADQRDRQSTHRPPPR